jgi:membrane protein DedA with SNARE-associated domain
MDWTTEAVALLGYGGVALLMLIEDIVLPIPSEVIMPAAGFLSIRFGLSIWGVVLAGTAGSLIGGLPWYYMGKAISRGRLPAWIERHRARFQIGDVGKAERWFYDHGGIAVLLARLLPGVRPLIGIPAGMARMPLSTFLSYSALGTVVWTGALAGAGRLVGANFHHVTGVLAAVMWLIVGITAVTWWALHLLRDRGRRLAADNPHGKERSRVP